MSVTLGKFPFERSRSTLNADVIPESTLTLVSVLTLPSHVWNRGQSAHSPLRSMNCVGSQETYPKYVVTNDTTVRRNRRRRTTFGETSVRV